MTFSDLQPKLLLFDAEYLRNGTGYKRSYYLILIETYALLRDVVSKMTLSDLE